MISDLDLDRWEAQLRKGSLGLAVLASLWEGKLYGLEILRRLDDVAGLSVPEGTIYPLLNRLRVAGYVEAQWVESDAGHPRKYYRLTPHGRVYLRKITEAWSEFASGIDRILAPMEKKAHASRKLA